MLRDWTQSDKVENISCEAERFFTRLIMKVDDYGCFWADTRLLKANLFPLKLDKVREADMLRWMAECQKAGLIVLYESNNKKYLQIQDFRQRLDKAKAKFPLPTLVNDSGEAVNDFPAELEIEVEKEIEVETRGAPARKFLKPSVYELKDYFVSIGLDDFTAEAQANLFISHYESNGWKVGKNPMKDWKASAVGWKSRMKDYGKNNSTNSKSGTEAIGRTIKFDRA